MARSKSYRKRNPHNLKWISSLVTSSLFSPSLFLVDQNRITTIRIPVSLFPFRCGPPFGFHPFQMGGRVSLLYWGVTRSWMPVAPLTPIYNNVPNTAHRISSWARLQNVMKLLFINTEDSLVLLAPYFAYPNCHHISLETTCFFPGRQMIWLSGFKTSLTSATLSSFLISKLHSRMRVCSVFPKTAILCAVSPLLSVLQPCVVVRWSCHNKGHSQWPNRENVIFSHFWSLTVTLRCPGVGFLWSRLFPCPWSFLWALESTLSVFQCTLLFSSPNAPASLDKGLPWSPHCSSDSPSSNVVPA